MKLVFPLIIAAASLGTSAAAWEGKVLECYNKTLMPTTYNTSKELVKKAKTKWEHRNGQMVKVYYPPVYVEHRTVKTPEHYVMQPAECNIAN